MPEDFKLDGLEFASLNLPYNKILRDLDDTPRLVAGENSYVTLGGKLIKRYGTIKVDDSELALRVDRMWLYETIDNPSYTFYLASVFDTSVWKLYYLRLDAGSPAWTTAGSFRSIDASNRPHEVVISRGLAYVKSFPSSETLGSVIFDGTGGTVAVKPWGALGPTTPAFLDGFIKHLNGAITAAGTSFVFSNVTSLPATPFNVQIGFEVITVVTLVGSTATVALRGAQGTVAAPHDNNEPIFYRNWVASNHPVVVNMFWAYTYAYKTITGHVTNRAPLQTNPDSLPSQTGPFNNLQPSVIVQGLADTTNFPTIIIYRTTDGGGTFMKLDEITNTGSGNIFYEDNGRTSTAGDEDPVADKDLNSQNLAPSLTSNSPPPTVLPPLVTGTNTPVAYTTPLVAFQGRIWYAIGNTVFFSANEELNVGIPEESFPSGLFGNFFRYNNTVTNMDATSDTLYIVTTKGVHKITGSTKQTFESNPVIKTVGGAQGQSNAITTYGDTLVWMTGDFRIAILQGQNFRTISEPLGTDYLAKLTSNAVTIDLKYWAFLDKEWITLTTINATDPTQNRTWIYDIKKSIELRMDFWNTPWSIPCTAIATGKMNETSNLNRLLFAMWNAVDAEGHVNRITTELDDVVLMDGEDVTGTDEIPAAGGTSTVTNYDFSVTSNLFQIPPGNHINALRRPGLVPIVNSLVIERSLFNGDIDPTLYYFQNDTWTYPIPSEPATLPSRDDEPRGYKTLIYEINKKARRFGFKVELLGSANKFELQNMAIIWDGNSGAGI